MASFFPGLDIFVFLIVIRLFPSSSSFLALMYPRLKFCSRNLAIRFLSVVGMKEARKALGILLILYLSDKLGKMAEIIGLVYSIIRFIRKSLTIIL